MITILIVATFFVIVVCVADAFSDKTDDERKEEFDRWVDDMRHGRR